jgi:hypothetical protein
MILFPKNHLSFSFYFKIFLLPVFLIFSASLHSQEGKGFEVEQQLYLQGNSVLIGNNILSQHKKRAIDQFDSFNDLIDMVYINVDGDRSTFSSSKARINESIGGKKVKYAALYWSAIYKYDKGFKRVRRNREVFTGNNSRSDDFHIVKFKTPGNEYLSIKGNVIFDSFYSDYFEETKPYVCYANVTSILNNLENLSGTYTLANMRATEGYISGGTAGGWLLYIVYEDEQEPPKYFTTYNGLMEVSRPSGVDMVFKDFMPVESGEINTSLLIGALEGDHKFKTDMVYLTDNKQNRFVPLSNARRPSNNFFNSTITIYDDHYTDRTPPSLNTLGFDLLKTKIPRPEDKIVLNETTELPVRFTTRADRYYLFFVGFETEISSEFLAQKTGVEIASLPLNDSPLKEILEPTPISYEDTVFENPKKQALYEELKAETAVYIPGLDQGFYLVTNVFSVEANVDNWKTHLRKKGFNPNSFINPENNWHYVYIDFNETAAELIEKQYTLSERQDLKKIWVLKINI